MVVRDAKELLTIAKKVSTQIKGEKTDSLRLECMNSLGVYTTTVTVGSVFSKWVQKLSSNDPKFSMAEVYNVRVHELKPVMREITSDVKREEDGQIIIDLKKCLDLEMFRLEIYYRMNESSLSALVHSRSSPEPFKDDMRYHLSAQLVDPPSLIRGFSEVWTWKIIQLRLAFISKRKSIRLYHHFKPSKKYGKLRQKCCQNMTHIKRSK